MPIFSTLLLLLFSSRILPYCPDYDFLHILECLSFLSAIFLLFQLFFLAHFLFNPDQFTVRVSLLASGHSPSSI